MKRNYLMVMLLCACFTIFSARAQFTDDMEYPGDEACADWWTTWAGDPCPQIVVGNSGEKIGRISEIPTSDALLDLGSKIFGTWGLEFDMYIPSGKEGYFSLQGLVPVQGGEWIVGSFLFNPDNNSPGQGEITDTALGSVIFDFPHDEWFRVAMNFDLLGLGGPTWGMSVNNTIVVTEGTLFSNSNGDFGTSLGGVEFNSLSSDVEYFVDNFNYVDGTVVLSTGQPEKLSFVLYPNPASDKLIVQTDSPTGTVVIYTLEGKKALQAEGYELIDVSGLTSGIYLVEVKTPQGKSIQKLIKK